MRKNNILLPFFLVCLFLCFCLPIQAQSKTHFRVLEEGVEVQNTLCHTAMAELDMDSFRYIDVRRQIPVEGTPYTVELFSGQELFNLYQKQISPNNRAVSQDAYPHLRLLMSGNRIKILP